MLPPVRSTKPGAQTLAPWPEQKGELNGGQARMLLTNSLLTGGGGTWSQNGGQAKTNSAAGTLRASFPIQCQVKPHKKGSIWRK